MMGDGTTVKAIDLKVGSMVQTSDGDSKEVMGVRLEKVAGTAADLCLTSFFVVMYVDTSQPKGRVDIQTKRIQELKRK